MSTSGSAEIRVAHAARVLVSAARRNELREESSRRKALVQRKVREGGPPSPAREPRALPRTTDPPPFISISCACYNICASTPSLHQSLPRSHPAPDELESSFRRSEGPKHH